MKALIRCFVFVLAISAFAVQAASPSAKAAYPGANGLLLFEGWGGNGFTDFDPSAPSYDIWTVAEDGSGLTNVTNGLGADADAQWSPDGQRIHKQQSWELRRFWCNWSPDGNMLSFVSGPDGHSGLGGKIFISSAEGANERLLTVSGASDFDPDWEPLRDQPE